MYGVTMKFIGLIFKGNVLDLAVE